MATRTVCLTFLTVAVACAATAIHYRGLLADARAKSASLEKKVHGSDGSTGAADEYTHAELISRKDAEIARLRREVGELKGGAGATQTTGSRSEFLRRQRERQAMEEADAAADTETAIDTPATRIYGSVSRHFKFFSAIDTASMEPGQADQHTRMVAALGDLETLLEMTRRVQSPDELSPLDAQLTTRLNALAPYLAAERDILIYSAGRQLGCDDETARWLLDYLKRVYELTDSASLTKSVWQGP